MQNVQQIKALYEKEHESIIGNCDTLLFLGGGNEPASLEFIVKLLGRETLATRTRGLTKGRNGSSTTNYQQTGRDLMTVDEVRKLDTNKAILFIRGEDPVIDRKYNLKRHPNIKLTSDGKAKPYIHKPQGVPDYALPDLPYAFKSLNDYEFIDSLSFRAVSLRHDTKPQRHRTLLRQRTDGELFRHAQEREDLSDRGVQATERTGQNDHFPLCFYLLQPR